MTKGIHIRMFENIEAIGMGNVGIINLLVVI
jgi:hypothetical protein